MFFFVPFPWAQSNLTGWKVVSQTAWVSHCCPTMSVVCCPTGGRPAGHTNRISQEHTCRFETVYSLHSTKLRQRLRVFTSVLLYVYVFCIISYLCVYVYRYICVYVYIYIYMCVYLYIYICVFIYICIYIYIHKYIYIYVYIYAYILYIYMHIYIYIHELYTCVCVHISVLSPACRMSAASDSKILRSMEVNEDLNSSKPLDRLHGYTCSKIASSWNQLEIHEFSALI